MTDRMTPAERAAARERCEKATPGEWWLSPNVNAEDGSGPAFPDVHAGEPKPHGEDICAVTFGTSTECKANAQFIAHARHDLPAALDEIDALEVTNIMLRAEIEERETRCNRCTFQRDRDAYKLGVEDTLTEASARTSALEVENAALRGEKKEGQ